MKEIDYYDIDRYQDGRGKRHYVRTYFDSDGNELFEVDALSVTTILDSLDEDKTGLEKWKAKNDGVDDNPHHAHLFWYSAPRGTLCHYQALQKFEGKFMEDEDLWGDEEQESMMQMMHGPDEDVFDEGEFAVEDDVSADTEDIVYSVLKKRGVVEDRDSYNAVTSLDELCHLDCKWFADTFDRICTELGITEETVHAIERYTVSELDCVDEANSLYMGYGGQCDIIYEDMDGNTVVADLKTSSGLRQKHRLQAVAYARSIEQEPSMDIDSVDRVEVIRIHPDSNTFQIHTNEVPEYFEHHQWANDRIHYGESTYTSDYWFEDKWGDFEYDSLDDMYDKFVSLVEETHDEEYIEDE